MEDEIQQWKTLEHEAKIQKALEADQLAAEKRLHEVDKDLLDAFLVRNTMDLIKSAEVEMMEMMEQWIMWIQTLWKLRGG